MNIFHPQKSWNTHRDRSQLAELFIAKYNQLEQVYKCSNSHCFAWMVEINLFKKTFPTRKSSCVHARGIPTAAYQVLHLLTEVGYTRPGLMGGYLRWGTPPPSRGTPGWTWLGYPPPPGPGQGTPPGVDRQTDTCQNITFPSYYVRGR